MRKTILSSNTSRTGRRIQGSAFRRALRINVRRDINVAGRFYGLSILLWGFSSQYIRSYGQFMLFMTSKIICNTTIGRMSSAVSTFVFQGPFPMERARRYSHRIATITCDNGLLRFYRTLWCLTRVEVFQGALLRWLTRVLGDREGTFSRVDLFLRMTTRTMDSRCL